MENKIWLLKLYREDAVTEAQRKMIGKNPCYDLGEIPSLAIRQEMAGFIRQRSRRVCIVRICNDRQLYKKLCRFLREYSTEKSSLRDKESDVWIRQLKGWMFREGIPLTEKNRLPNGSISMARSRVLTYFEKILEFTMQQEGQPEREKDIWKLERLDIKIRGNPIKNYRTINFTDITQKQLREEVKKGIYLNLQGEAVSCVGKEMAAVRRLSRYLKEKHSEVQSCQEIDRNIVEDYLIYLKTEATETKHYHADLNRLRALLESIGQVCGYANLCGLFLTRDIPPVPKAEFKTYSDAELRRFNAAIVEMDEQTARLMVIHQMLGTRISDT